MPNQYPTMVGTWPAHIWSDLFFLHLQVLMRNATDAMRESKVIDIVNVVRHFLLMTDLSVKTAYFFLPCVSVRLCFTDLMKYNLFLENNHFHLKKHDCNNTNSDDCLIQVNVHLLIYAFPFQNPASVIRF